MDILSVLIGLLGALSNFGPVGKVLAVVVALAIGLSAVANAVVTVWHALVAFFSALSLLPYVGGVFAGIATFMRVEEPKLSDFVNNKLIAILAQISAIPLPNKPASLVEKK